MKAKKYMMGGATTPMMPTAAKTPMLPSSTPMQAQRKPTMMAKGGAVKAANCGASMKPTQKGK